MEVPRHRPRRGTSYFSKESGAMKALLATAAVAALLTTGCAQSLPSVAAADTSGAAIAEVQTTVDEAVTAVKSYGQKHLGHYLEMDRDALRAEGFTPAEGVAVTVSVDHLGVCINAATDALPADNEWSTATATTAAPEAVAGGRCSSDALRTFTIRG